MAEPAPVTRDSPVTLREVTADTVRAICRLAVRPDQAQFVANNAVSIAEAHFAPYAWFRAIYAGETPVGFVMVSDRPEMPDYFLWRFMIDARYQKMGFGRTALEQVIARIRTRPGAVKFETSIVPGEGTPQGFYESLGFRLTGDVEEGELVMRLDLVPPA